MTIRTRLPRHHRAPFQRLPLPTWLRVIVISVGWLMILVGIAGLFLPILQGGLMLALGLAHRRSAARRCICGFAA